MPDEFKRVAARNSGGHPVLPEGGIRRHIPCPGFLPKQLLTQALGAAQHIP